MEEEEEVEEEAVFIRGVNTNRGGGGGGGGGCLYSWCEHKEEVVVVFTRENRGGSAQHAGAWEGEEIVLAMETYNGGGRLKVL